MRPIPKSTVARTPASGGGGSSVTERDMTRNRRRQPATMGKVSTGLDFPTVNQRTLALVTRKGYLAVV